MRVNIIYGIYKIGDTARVAIKKDLTDAGCEVVDDSIVRAIKTGIDQAVSNYASEDQLVLILSHKLEDKNPFTINDLLRYQKAVPNIKIVFIVESDMKGSELLQDMSNNGMYLAMYANETSGKTIRDLIVTGRTVEDAKRYYGVKNLKNISKQITIEGAVQHIMQPTKNNKDYIERVRWVKNTLASEDEFVACIKRLPNEVKEVLSQHKAYLPYVEDYVIAKSGTGIRTEEKSGGFFGRFKKKDKESKKERAMELLEEELDRRTEAEEEKLRVDERTRKEGITMEERERKERELIEAKRREELSRKKKEEEVTVSFEDTEEEVFEPEAVEPAEEKISEPVEESQEDKEAELLRKQQEEAEQKAETQRIADEQRAKEEEEKRLAEETERKEREEAEKKAAEEKRLAEEQLRLAEEAKKRAEEAESKRLAEEKRIREMEKEEEERKAAEDFQRELEIMQKQREEEKAEEARLRRERIRIEAEERAKAEIAFKREEAERKAAARAEKEAALREEAAVSAGIVKSAVKSAIRRTVIGVAGAQRHVGCTHQALLIAHTLSAMGFKVAVVEDYNQADKVFDIIAGENGKESDDVFNVNGVDYYACFSLRNLPDLNVKNYNFVIVDFGLYDDDMIEEYGRCSLQILVSGSRVWETIQLSKVFGSVTEEQLKTYNFLFIGTPEEKKASFKKDMQPMKHVFFGEYAPNPYSSEGYQAIKDILDDFIVTEDAGKKKAGIFSKWR